MNKFLIMLWVVAPALFVFGLAILLVSYNGLDNIFDPNQIAASITGVIIGAALIAFGLLAALAALATTAITADIRTATRMINETSTHNHVLGQQFRQDER